MPSFVVIDVDFVKTSVSSIIIIQLITLFSAAKLILLNAELICSTVNSTPSRRPY